MEISLDKLASSVNKLFTPFFVDDAIYKIDREGSIKPWSDDDPLGWLPVCILSRSQYFEQSKSYPIKNWVHLLRVIRSDAKTISPFGTESQWVITGKNERGVSVTFWSVNQNVKAMTKKFRFMIPETLLLAYFLSNSEGILETEKGVFVTRPPHEGVRSALKDDLVPTVHRFAELIGRGDNVVVDAFVSESEHTNALLTGLSKLPIWNIAGLWIAPEKRPDFDVLTLKFPLLAMIGVFMAYAVGVEYYQTNKLELLQEKVTEQQKQATYIASLERSNSEIEGNLNYYNDLVELYPGAQEFYLALYPIFKQSDAKLTNFVLNGNMLKIYGIATSVTVLFEKLAIDPRFKGVKISGNLSNDRRTGKERFIIEMTLVDEAQNDK